jgi:uncharacterized protein (DUF58 family)
MDDPRQYLDPHVLARLRGLDLKARLIVEGYMAGLHKSPYQGFSVEFAEHREYVAGDDLRYVDWKVYGKSDRYYLKQFEEETNFACHLLLDTSESMRYKSDPPVGSFTGPAGAAKPAVSKLEYAQLVAASLAYLVVQQQDAVGLATFDTAVTHLIRPAGTPSHLNQLFHVMEQTPARGETALGPILHDLAERIKKRGLVIVISDLFDDVDALMLGLKHFRHRRHDVSLMQIIDPAEQDFPFEDPTLFKGLEAPAEQMTDPRALKRAYQREFESFLRQVRRGCRDLQMDYVLLRTDMPLDVALSSYLTRRRGRAK